MVVDNIKEAGCRAPQDVGDGRRRRESDSNGDG